MEEWFVHFSRWIPKRGWNFPTRDEVLLPFGEEGLAGDVRPMWGRTPFNSHLFTFRRKDEAPQYGSSGAKAKMVFSDQVLRLFGIKGGKFAMKTVNEILGGNQTLRGALRVLTGKTNSGKRAIYISGNPAGFRLAGGDSAGPGRLGRRWRRRLHISFKLERESGSLFFETDDSVDIFEIHCDDHFPEKHETPSVRKD